MTIRADKLADSDEVRGERRAGGRAALAWAKRSWPWLSYLMAGVLFAVLTILMTWPLVLRMTTHFAGADVDVFHNTWYTWWTEKAILEGRSLYYTRFMFFPRGTSLAFHNSSYANSALELLFRPLLGSLAAYNATVILAHALSGFGMYCLVRYVSGDSTGAFLAGLAFAFFPYRMNESAHPNVVSTQWMPLYLLFLLRLLREGRKRYAFLGALFFVLNALSGWHLVAFATLLTVAYLAYSLAFERASWSWATVRNLAMVAGLISLVLVPLLYPLAQELLTTSGSYFGVDLKDGRGNDLLSFLLPAEAHPVLGRLAEPLYAKIKPGRAAYLGVMVLALSLVGALACWRHSRFWVLLALSSALLSLGPHLTVGGHDLGVLLPWSVAVVWLFRNPFRLGLLLGLALAVTSGLGLSAVLHRLAGRRSRWRWPVGVGVTALLLFEYLYLPFPTTPAVASGFYADLSAVPGQGAVLGLPMGRHASKRYMYYQTIHGRPQVEGMVSRTPAGAYASIEAAPALRSLRRCGEYALPPAGLPSILDDLSELGIEYAIVHKDWPAQPSLDVWLSARTAAPEYEDEQIAVYRTWENGQNSAGEAQLLESCVAVRHALDSPVLALAGETLDVPLEWMFGSTPGKEYALDLALTDQIGETLQRQRFKVLPGTRFTAIQGGSRHRVAYPFPVDPYLAPGPHRLQARLVPVDWGGEALLSADLPDVEVLPGSEITGTSLLEGSTAPTFGGSLQLLGYELDQAEEAIDLVLHWRLLRRMHTDYKFFVHLYESTGDVIVSQRDVMPHDWTHPTSNWEMGEMVRDVIVVPLEGVPPGRYCLAVGVYDPATGERLLLGDAEGASKPLDRLVLVELLH